MTNVTKRAAYRLGHVTVYNGTKEQQAMANNSGGTLTKEELVSLLNYIFTLADGVGNTKQEMAETLQKIADLADPETDVVEGDDGEWEVVDQDGEDDESEDDE